LKPEQLTPQAAGRLIMTAQGSFAFVPDDLPPTVAYQGDLVRLLSAADAALSELSGRASALPNPHLLIAPYIRREAVLSSRIEGTRATLSDLLMDELGEAAPAPRPPPSDVNEVRNYVVALEYGMARLSTLPLSLRLVRELHERLMRGVRGDHATPGEFRRSQNRIGPAGSTPATAPYVPPPTVEMNRLLDDWERFLHARDAFPDLIQAAIMHAQFEAIHPFLDGNGRVGRLLITLFLVERRRLPQPLLYLSAFIEANRNDYCDLLQRVHTHGDWHGWFRYFLAGVVEIATEATGKAETLLAMREGLRVELARKPRAAALVDHLFENPFVTVARAAKLLEVTTPTARNAVEALVNHGVLVEQSGRQWGRVYLAKRILDAIERREAAVPGA
jgi:Fic family protein